MFHGVYEDPTGGKFGLALTLLAVVVCLHADIAFAGQDQPSAKTIAPPAKKKLPLLGDVFEVEGHTAFVVLPKPELRVAGMP